MVQKVGGLLEKKGKKARGLWAKLPCLLPPCPGKQGRGAQGAGGLGPVALELGSGLGKGEKEPGGAGDRFPAAARPGAVQGDLATEAVGQRAAEAPGRRPRGAAASNREGKTSRGSGNPISPLTSVRDGSGMAPHGGGRSFGDNGDGGGAGSFREKLGGRRRWW